MKVNKSVEAVVKAVDDGSANGSFDAILSNEALDRDGERLRVDDWAPLPDKIPINVNHSPDVRDIIASGTPSLDDQGNLRVKGTFASTPEAQHIRSLVAEGHLRSVSVEFLRRKSAGGRLVNELVGGAFVNVPSNPEAVVLSAKGVPSFPVFKELLNKTVAQQDTSALLQAIHDGSVHLGAECVPRYVESDDEDASGADDGANKQAQLLRLRLKALG